MLRTTTRSGGRAGGCARRATSRPSSRVAAATWPGSRPPPGRAGVPTQISASSSRSVQGRAEAAASRRPVATPWASRAASPGSRTGERPAATARTTAGSGSTPSTWWPSRARQAAVVAPTWPRPRMAMCTTCRLLAGTRPAPAARLPAHRRGLRQAPCRARRSPPAEGPPRGPSRKRPGAPPIGSAAPDPGKGSGLCNHPPKMMGGQGPPAPTGPGRRPGPASRPRPGGIPPLPVASPPVVAIRLRPPTCLDPCAA